MLVHCPSSLRQKTHRYVFLYMSRKSDLWTSIPTVWGPRDPNLPQNPVGKRKTDLLCAIIRATRAGRTDHQRHPRRRCLRSLLRCHFALWGCGRSEAWSSPVSDGGGLRTANQTIPKTHNDQHKTTTTHSLLPRSSLPTPTSVVSPLTALNPPLF